MVSHAEWEQQQILDCHAYSHASAAAPAAALAAALAAAPDADSALIACEGCTQQA
jgi:hypothetical protein